jgi:hypothetical protein
MDLDRQICKYYIYSRQFLKEVKRMGTNRKSAKEVQKNLQVKMENKEELAPKSVTSGNPEDDTQTQAMQEAEQVMRQQQEQEQEQKQQQMQQQQRQAVEPVQQVDTTPQMQRNQQNRQ